MQFIESLTTKLGIMGELCLFFLQHRWWWLTPMLIVLFLVGGLLVFAQSSAVAPFIYTLF